MQAATTAVGAAMIEELATSSVHVLKPGRPRSTKSPLAQSVYAQMRRDFMVAAPFVLHAEIPELLAAAWALVRETLLAGSVPRAQKELIAEAISKANECVSPTQYFPIGDLVLLACAFALMWCKPLQMPQVRVFSVQCRAIVDCL
jgi:hypothetical protein